MTPPTLKECVTGKVTFSFYRDNTLFYKTENGLTFPVPIHDTGTATFKDEDKGIFFMRWIRKFLDELKTGEPSANSYLHHK